MESNFAARPEVEIQEIAERAIASGASPEFTVNHLCERGVREEVARKIVNGAVAKTADQRERVAELRAATKRTNLRLAVFVFLFGLALLSAGYFEPKLRDTWFAGLAFIFLAIRFLLRGLLRG